MFYQKLRQTKFVYLLETNNFVFLRFFSYFTYIRKVPESLLINFLAKSSLNKLLTIILTIFKEFENLSVEKRRFRLSIIIQCGSDTGVTMCPTATTCGKSDRARIGTWEQVEQFLNMIFYFLLKCYRDK